MKKNHIILIIVNGVGIVLLALCYLLSKNTVFIQNNYVRGIYPGLIKGLTSISGGISFTLMERFVIGALIAVVLAIVLAVYYVIKGPRRRSVSISLVLLAFVIYNLFLYQFLWGLNNYRPSIEKQLELVEGPIDEETLADTYEYMIEQANSYGEKVHVSGLLGAMTFSSMAEESTKGYPELEKIGILNHTVSSTPVKPLLISPWMTSSGYTGIYLYLFSEPSINREIPMTMMPFTAMHELAHQQGYGSEAEANFMGFLSGVYHPNIVFRYSAYLAGMTYVGNALYSTNPNLYIELREQQNTYVKEDLNERQVFWKEHTIERNRRIQNNLNDRFLKANNQPDGVKNYSNVTQLLVKAYKKQLLPK